MKRTQAEIDAQIVALKSLAERFQRARGNIQIVIDTLEEGRSVDDVYDQFDTEDPQFQYAHDAALWLAGESDESPSEGWD